MQRIDAIIAGRTIPLKVTQEEEMMVRGAIEEINARILQYQSEYTQKDIQDCLLMTLLTYAVDNHKTRPRVLDESSMDILADIREQLKVLESQSSD